jgi:hypothetical protein
VGFRRFLAILCNSANISSAQRKELALQPYRLASRILPNLIPGPSTPTNKARMRAAAIIHLALRVIAPAETDESLALAPEK